MDTTIRWGILGCGAVTEKKSGPAFRKAEGSALAAVMRRTAALAEDYARRHDVPKWTSDAGALINDPDVDAVYVATPVGDHMDLALQVCAAGKPCYVEKPMARSHAECSRMNDAFDRAGLPLFVAYYRRALPKFLKAKEFLDTGRIGPLRDVNCRYAWNRPAPEPGSLPWRLVARDAGGGLFMDLGSHTLDILDFILGPLTEVAGSAANRGRAYDVEDFVSMQFGTSNGVRGFAEWDFAAKDHEDRITFTGTDGQLVMSTFGAQSLDVVSGDTSEHFEFPEPEHIQQQLIHSVVAELLGRGHCPSTGRSAARTSRVIDRVLNDYYGGRNDAFWERPETWPGRPSG